MRRFILELFALLPTALAMAYLGPFGTYDRMGFADRCTVWALLLLSAYVLARPALLFWKWAARRSKLPQRGLSLWGMTVSSAPMALIFLEASPAGLRGVIGFGGMLPFALLSSILVMAISWWAERVDARIAAAEDDRASSSQVGEADGSTSARDAEPEATTEGAGAAPSKPQLLLRLGAGSDGRIAALQAEDHYVRIHKADGTSHLVLVRLRDAIAEMDGVAGRQVHRSWWVARDAIAEVVELGRGTEISLHSWLRVPIARDLVPRLRSEGFLAQSRLAERSRLKDGPPPR